MARCYAGLGLVLAAALAFQAAGRGVLAVSGYSSAPRGPAEAGGEARVAGAGTPPSLARSNRAHARTLPLRCRLAARRGPVASRSCGGSATPSG